MQYLPPMVRAATGLLMLGLGIAAMCMLASYWSIVLLGIAGATGGPLLVRGWFDWRRHHARGAAKRS